MVLSEHFKHIILFFSICNTVYRNIPVIANCVLSNKFSNSKNINNDNIATTHLKINVIQTCIETEF